MDVDATLKGWSDSLCKELPLGGLVSRNHVAHKWKAPFRSISLRETLLWRVHDLLTQSLFLHRHSHTLGARILLRSAFEALATLIYLNSLTEQVIEGLENFHDFSEKTSQMLLGCKNKSTTVSNINIVTVLNHANKRYDGISNLYASLSESAHPSYEGLCRGYSRVDHDNLTTYFENRWHNLHGASYMEILELCITVFEHEYNDVWDNLFVQLEQWIEENDAHLEKTKPSRA